MRKLLAILTGVTTLVVTATPAAAVTYSKMRNAAAYRLCLDADANRGGANGTVVQLWECSNALPAWQSWSFESQGPGIWKIRSANGGRCLDADISRGPISNGARIQLWDCWETSNQLWYRFAVNGRFLMVNGGPGQPYCLDADSSRPLGNGTVVHLWQCNTLADWQSWPVNQL